MMLERNKRHHGAGGYWLEKADQEVVRKREGSDSMWNYIVGIKRTFQFHTSNGKETNWFMHEYSTTTNWGIDLYLGVRIARILAPTFAMLYAFNYPFNMLYAFNYP